MDPNTPTVKHIAGQAIYQLAVMYGLIFYAPALLGIPGMGGAGLGVPAAAPAGWTGCNCAAALRPPPAQPATASRPPTTRLLPAGSWVVVAGSSKHSSTADAQRSALLSQCQPTCSTDTQIASFCSLQTTRLWLAPASTTPWYSTHLSSCRQACACRFWLLLLCPLMCQLLRPLRPLLLPAAAPAAPAAAATWLHHAPLVRAVAGTQAHHARGERAAAKSTLVTGWRSLLTAPSLFAALQPAERAQDHRHLAGLGGTVQRQVVPGARADCHVRLRAQERCALASLEACTVAPGETPEQAHPQSAAAGAGCCARQAMLGRQRASILFSPALPLCR